MAAIAKVGTPSVASVPLDPNDKLSNRIAGEAIGPCDACELHADNMIYKATTRVDGFSFTGAAKGEPVTLAISKVRFRYGKTGTAAPDIVVPKFYYLSTTIPGGLDDTVNGAVVAVGLDNGVLQVQPSY